MTDQFRIGKNAVENTELVLQSSDRDVWFHIRDNPSAHLVYFNPSSISLGELRRTGIIYRMALELKKRSKYSKKNTIQVIYDYIENINPTPKPGMVNVTSSVKNIKA